MNSIAPGLISTPIWGTVGLSPEQLQAVSGQVTQRLLPGQFGAPEDIAQTAVFLTWKGSVLGFYIEVVSGSRSRLNVESKN